MLKYFKSGSIQINWDGALAHPYGL
jgi:hypothetical protein